VQANAKVTKECEHKVRVCRMMLFPVTLSDPNPSFKVMVLFKGECLKTVHFTHPRDAMLARVIAIAACLSVCPSVCPSRAGVVYKVLHYTILHQLYLFL